MLAYVSSFGGSGDIQIYLLNPISSGLLFGEGKREREIKVTCQNGTVDVKGAVHKNNEKDTVKSQRLTNKFIHL